MKRPIGLGEPRNGAMGAEAAGLAQKRVSCKAGRRKAKRTIRRWARRLAGAMVEAKRNRAVEAWIERTTKPIDYGRVKDWASARTGSRHEVGFLCGWIRLGTR